MKYRPLHGLANAGVVKPDNDAGLKIPSLVVRGFESLPPHSHAQPASHLPDSILGCFFSTKRGFFKTGSVALLLGVILNLIGTIYVPKKIAYSLMSASDAYLVNTFSSVSMVLITLGLIIISAGMLRAD